MDASLIKYKGGKGGKSLQLLISLFTDAELGWGGVGELGRRRRRRKKQTPQLKPQINK